MNENVIDAFEPPGADLAQDVFVRMPTGEIVPFSEIRRGRMAVTRGGEGSGHFEHEGRPGEVGGSLPSGADKLPSYEPRIKGSFVMDDRDPFRLISAKYFNAGKVDTRGVRIYYDLDKKGQKEAIVDAVEFLEDTLNYDISDLFIIADRDMFIEFRKEHLTYIRTMARESHEAQIASNPEWAADTVWSRIKDLDLEGTFDFLKKGTNGVYDSREQYIWLNTETLPSAKSKQFRKTLWHEIAHHIDNQTDHKWLPPESKNKWDYSTKRERWNNVSWKYAERVSDFYGWKDDLRKEYFADLTMAAASSAFYDEAPRFGRRVGHRPLSDLEQGDMDLLFQWIANESQHQALLGTIEGPQVERAIDGSVMVSFADGEGYREELRVPLNDIENLPDTAIILDPETMFDLGVADQLIERGGEGSGHHDHEGRPGEVGGSLPSGEIAIEDESEWKITEGGYAYEVYEDRLVEVIEDKGDNKYKIEVISGPERGAFYQDIHMDDLEEPDYDLLELWTADDIDSTIERAKEIFGLTDDWNEAGYILDDGEMLDFSGKNEGGSAGMRSRDHREIGQAFAGDTPSYTAGMVWFMDKARAIRMSLNYGGLMVDFAGPPTRAQRDLIESIGMQSEEVYWDVSRWYDADPEEGTEDRYIDIESGETSNDLEEIEDMLEGIRGIYYSPDYEERSWIARTLKQIINILRGGEGSGHHGHEGRPGEVGGSLPSGGEQAALFTEHEKAAIPKVKQLIENDQDILTDEQIARWNPETYNRFSFSPDFPRETELAKEAVRRFYQRTGIAPESIHFTDIWKIYVPEMLDAQGETILSPNAEAFIRQYAQQHRERLGGAYLPTKDLIFVNTDKSGLGTYEGDETMWHEIAHAVERDFKLSENEVVEPGNRYFSRMVFEYGYEGDDVGAEYVADLITSHVRGPVMVDDDGDVGEKYVFGRGDNQIIFSERDNQNRKTIIENLLLWSVPYMEQDMMEEIVVERAGGGRMKYVMRPEGWIEGLWVEDDIITRGGPGSGHHGHRGRPGQIGGSLPAVSGECYMASARWIMDEGKAIEDEAMLVHGTVAGQGPLEGLRIAHAWVEFGDLVYDAATDMLVRKERYYEIGKVKDTIEYDPTEMRVNLLKTENWGPWDDRFMGGPWEEKRFDYPLIGETVDGRTVGEDVPNTASISASLFDYEVLPGIREVPFSAFTQMDDLYFYSADQRRRTEALAEAIKETKHIVPLIVVIDNEGPYVLEGGHRFDALRMLDAKFFPALVVVDHEPLVERGGPGSGHEGHRGRPGEVGGSLPSGAAGGAQEKGITHTDDLRAYRKKRLHKLYKELPDAGKVRRSKKAQEFLEAATTWFLDREVKISFEEIDSINHAKGFRLRDDSGNILTVQVGEMVWTEYKPELIMSWIDANNKGTGFGSAFMRACKSYADAKAMPFRIIQVTNPKFYRRFDWLVDLTPGEDYGNNEFLYEPSIMTSRTESVQPDEGYDWAEPPHHPKGKQWPPEVPVIERVEGEGKGYHDPHYGRPGEVGGSLPRGEGSAETVEAEGGERKTPQSVSEYIDTFDAVLREGETERDLKIRVYKNALRIALEKLEGMTPDEILGLDRNIFNLQKTPLYDLITGDDAIEGMDDEQREFLRQSYIFGVQSGYDAALEFVHRRLVAGGKVALDDTRLLYGASRPQGTGEWAQMPETLYHVTTAADAIRADTIKSRFELGLWSTMGLGGGEEDTISFSADLDVAKDIDRSLHEGSAAARGDFTIEQMVRWAAEGVDAPKPYLGFLYALMRGGVSDFTIGEIDARVAADPTDIPPDVQKQFDSYMNREREYSEFEFYQSYWANARAHEGGPQYPLFWGVDKKALAEADASQFTILEFTPSEGSLGYQMGGLGEWRTVGGENVSLVGEHETLTADEEEEYFAR